MAGLFGSPFSSNNSFREGIVTNVDPIRFNCSVRTSSGQTFNNVTWLLPTGGSGADGVHLTPNVFDKVLVCTTTASPIIVGCIPRVGTPDTLATSVSNNTLTVDSGNSSSLKNGFSLNPNKPNDFLPGDKVLSTRGGGLIALLTSGGILLKSSSLAQIFISKFNGMVRIVSRNFHRYSDASSEVSVNLKGALYRWFGADWDLTRTTSNTERYNEAVGHITAAKSLRGEPTADSTIPVRDTRVREYWLTDTSGNEVMIESLYDSGKLIFTVKQVGGGTSVVTHDNAEWQSQVTNGTTSTITILPGSIVVNHNNVSIATLDPSHINLNYNGVSTANLNASGVQLNFGGHGIVVDSTGTHLS